MRHIICVSIILIMLTMTQAVPAFADSTDPADSSANVVSEASGDSSDRKDASVITGFGALKETSYTYSGKPSREELLEPLPDTIRVNLKGSKEETDIPVRWETAEDYGNTDFYFYSARPVWSGEYVLSSDLDPQVDVPWVMLFLYSADLDPDSEEDILKDASSSVSDVKKIYTCLTEKMGLNMAAACGVMTNLYAESGMKSNNLENTYNALYGLSDAEYTKRVNKGKKNKGKYKSGYGATRYFTTDYSGYGICQWTTSGRRANLLKAAVKKDVSIANLNMQMGVMKGELKNGYQQVWGTLKGVPNNATGVYLAAAHFCASFEIPANTNATAASRARTALSTYWKSYSGKSASAKGKSFLGLCGYSYPKTVKKGTGVIVSGQVISNYTIRTVTTKIKDSEGKTVYSKTRKPGASIYSLYNFDSSMKFRKLNAGTYTYLISAKDSHGKQVMAKHRFKVSKNGETVILRGCATKDVR